MHEGHMVRAREYPGPDILLLTSQTESCDIAPCHVQTATYHALRHEASRRKATSQLCNVIREGEKPKSNSRTFLLRPDFTACKLA